MYRFWQPRNMQNCSVLLVGFVFLVGCLGSVTGEGAYESGSILNVESITGVYLTDKLTNQVDVVMGVCGTEPPYTPEPYSDHFAEVQISNRAFPNASEQTASTIYLDAYTIDYIIVDSSVPLNPPTSPYPPGDTLVDSQGIPPCEPGAVCAFTTYSGLKFVDIGTKDEYIDKGGNPYRETRYLIHYTFYGKNDFGKRVSFEAKTDFTMLNYDYCD